MKLFVVCLIGVLISSFVSSQKYPHKQILKDNCFAISIKETFDSEIIMVISLRHCPRKQIKSIYKIQVYNPKVLCELLKKEFSENKNIFKTEIYFENMEKKKSTEIEEEILASCKCQCKVWPLFIFGKVDTKWYENSPLQYLNLEVFNTKRSPRTFVTYEKQKQEMIIYKSQIDNNTIIPKKTVSLSKLYENCKGICDTDSSTKCFDCVDNQFNEIFKQFKYSEEYEFNTKFESTMWTSGTKKTMMNYFMKKLIEEEEQDEVNDMQGYFFNLMPTQE